MVRPTCIDLFAGVGGLSLGFEQAGFDVLGAIEIDPIHAAVHEFNFPNCAVLPRSVVGLSGAEIRQAGGIANRRIDVVVGGAPCQGFSLIGHRALDDPRNSLVGEFVRLVAELNASYFVFENVKGLTVGKHRRFLDEVIGAFSAVGYTVLSPWKVLNAASYGVPQDRERLFLIGARRGMPLPTYPKAISSPAGGERNESSSGPSCRDALGDLLHPASRG
ncbi:MAG: DNA cytosine methyltransferase, partial [Hyphomicrobiaceae bacterium]